jgi:5-methylcytosine-specific restriction endonuclease McrA
MALPPPKQVEIGAFYAVFGDHGIIRRVGAHDPICAWCKKAFNPWEVQVDHIKPYARFKRPEEADRLANLQVLCTEHHRAKTKTDLKVLSRVR